MAIAVKEGRHGPHFLSVKEKRERTAGIWESARRDFADSRHLRVEASQTIRNLHPITAIRRGKGQEVAQNLGEAAAHYANAAGLFALGILKRGYGIGSSIDTSIVGTGTVIAHPIATTNGAGIFHNYERYAEKREKIEERPAVAYRAIGVLGIIGAMTLAQTINNGLSYGEWNPFYAPPVLSI